MDVGISMCTESNMVIPRWDVAGPFLKGTKDMFFVYTWPLFLTRCKQDAYKDMIHFDDLDGTISVGLSLVFQ